MKVLYIAAECKPFSKAGGVGDVAGELPVALKAQGVDIEVVTPWYGPRPPGAATTFQVPFHGAVEDVAVESAELKGVGVHLVRNATYFETDYTREPRRPAPGDPYLFRRDYSKPYVDSEPIPFHDDVLRFSFFSEACIEVIERRRPDIVHVNDWVLGFLFGRMAMKRMPQKRVLTIHNIGYQGNIGRASVAGWDLEAIARSEVGPLFADPRTQWASVNPLRLAMELADRANTVSPTYMKEMTQPEDRARYFEGGKGLHETAARLARERKLHGILNGFEYSTAPGDDAFRAALEEKAAMRAALAGSFPQPAGTLLGFVGRAVEQKFRLLTERLEGRSVMEHILSLPGINVAMVATGLPEYERFMRRFQGRPNFSATIGFDRALARRVSLGADVFLMPSLFEPCGITQMESLSCATPPLVRWTGGLVDTVKPHTGPGGTGFGFDGATAPDVLRNLVGSVAEAARIHREAPQHFRAMQRRGFDERFPWSTSARRYIQELYEPAMAGRRAG